MRAGPAPLAVLVLLALLCAPLCRAAPVRVEIVGLDATLERNARAHLSLGSGAAQADLPESNIRSLHARAPIELRDALIPFGYYSPKIESSLSLDNGTWVAHYTVDPGEPVLVSSVDVQISGDGAEEPSLQSVLKTAAVREGATLRHDVYEQTKGALLAAALEHGYRDAQFTESRIDVDPAARAEHSPPRVPAALRALRARRSV
jgi:translocation and assembly module TamA